MRLKQQNLMNKIMKIGVISDTHMLVPSKSLIELSQGAFSDISYLFHAGDIVKPCVLDVFGDKEIVAVCGNMDGHDVCDKYPVKEIRNINNFKIGIMHGWGSKEGLAPRIIDSFDSDMDIIIYGHSHKPANYLLNGTLLFNPGSFSQHNNSKSAGIINLGKEIKAEIIYF